MEFFCLYHGSDAHCLFHGEFIGKISAHFLRHDSIYRHDVLDEDIVVVLLCKVSHFFSYLFQHSAYISSLSSRNIFDVFRFSHRLHDLTRAAVYRCRIFPLTAVDDYLTCRYAAFFDFAFRSFDHYCRTISYESFRDVNDLLSL